MIFHKLNMCILYEPRHEISNNGMCDQQSLRSACAYAQSDQSLCLSLEYRISVQLLTEHHLRFLGLKGGCIGLLESKLVKMPNCWKSHVATPIMCTFDNMVLSVELIHCYLKNVFSKIDENRCKQTVASLP